jgi:PIF1-like helicase/DNA helicase Pif1-like protein
MNGMRPAVTRLALHEPENALFFFDDHDDAAELRRRGQPRTTLTEFFTFNRLHPGRLQCTYVEAVKHLTWDPQRRLWKVRQRATGTIGRVAWASPRQQERFYLRILLHHVIAPTCFRDVRTFNGVTYGTFQAACLARGLLTDDAEWHGVLQEAAEMRTGRQLRQLFVTILTECEPSNPAALWEQHRRSLSDDCAHQLRARRLRAEPTEQDEFNLALQLIEMDFDNRGKPWPPELPRPTERFDLNDGRPRMVAEELEYDAVEMGELRDRAEQLMRDNAPQRVAYERVCASARDQRGELFFLDGPGGTGKTFVENAILASLRADGLICLPVGSSGICSILLRGGRTAHSRFKIPLDIQPNSTCGISKQSGMGELLRRASLIIWDEAPMMHRHCFEALDRSLRDIREDERFFGGVTMLMAGDFRQVLPVIPRAGRGAIVEACITEAPFWPVVSKLSLTRNMRLERSGMSAEQRARVAEFARSLLDVGDGNVRANGGVVGSVAIAPEYRTEDDTDLLDSIFPNLDRARDVEESRAYFTKAAILAARNDDVHQLNTRLLASLPGESREYVSFDKAFNNADAGVDGNAFPPDYLNTLNPQGMTTHRLELKVGAPVMLLRNVSSADGLCNGTRLLITRLRDRVIEARIMGGERDGEMVFVSRIYLDSSASSGLPFTLRRLQLPIRLAFAMTINKSQGQSLQRVGVYLNEPVFTHGQLYVALSRAEVPARIKVMLFGDDARRGSTANVVYTEVLDRVRQDPPPDQVPPA